MGSLPGVKLSAGLSISLLIPGWTSVVHFGCLNEIEKITIKDCLLWVDTCERKRMGRSFQVPKGNLFL